MRFSVFVLSGCLAIPAAGCVTFAPKYNDVIYQKLDAVGSELAKIATLIETRAPQPVGYSALEPFYVAALASAKEAHDLAGERPAYLDGQPAAKSAELVASNIDACGDAIEFSRDRVRREGQARNELDNIAIVRNICAIPKTMEGLLK